MEDNNNSMRIHLDDNLKQFIREIKIGRKTVRDSILDIWDYIDKSRYKIHIKLGNSLIILDNCKVIHDVQAHGIRSVECDGREELNTLVNMNNDFMISKECILNDLVVFENVTFNQSNELYLFKGLVTGNYDTFHKEMNSYEFIPEAFDFPTTIDGKMLMLKYKTKPMGMIFLIDEIQRDKIKLINVKTRLQHVWSPYKFLLGSTFEEHSRYDYDCGEIIPKLEKVIPLVPYEMNKEE